MLLWVAVFCLAVTMFFSAAEMSFIAANRLRIRHLPRKATRRRPPISRRSAGPSAFCRPR